MYEYTEVTDVEGFIDVPVPSSGGKAVIRVPKMLDHGTLKLVRSSAYAVRPNPDTGRLEDVFDMSTYWDAICKAALCDPRTQHELYHQGRKIDLTPEWIDRRMKPMDALRIGQVLASEYAEQLAMENDNPNSQSGPDETPNGKHASAASRKTAAVPKA